MILKVTNEVLKISFNGIVSPEPLLIASIKAFTSFFWP
jgi:hypothetical protein